MVVLAASITTLNGRPLLSRQFKDITRDRVMELLSNFQDLVANSSCQHTFVEDEHVRYVYKPFDDYYIILITNHQSNIIQDLDTLNLFAQTVNSSLKGFSEDEIFDNAFDILRSFDEIISMGYKENLSLAQIKTFLSMESHEETIQEIIERNKEFEAAEERKRRAKEISRREQERKMGIVSPGSNTYGQQKFHTSSDPNLTNAYNSYYSHASSAAQQSYYQAQKHVKTGEEHILSSTTPLSSHSSSTKGMKLGFKKNTALSSRGIKSTSLNSNLLSNTSEEEKPSNNGILISIKETINAELTRDGTISTSELKGVLELRINDPNLARARINLDPQTDVRDRTYQFKTHPNIDKNLFLSSKVIGLRDASKSFPSNDQSLGVLRWRKVGLADDHSLIPLEISTWVSPSDSRENMFDVTIEFEVNSEYNQSLENVRFIVPVATENAIINNDANDNGASIEFIDEQGIIINVGSVSPSASRVIEFAIEASYEDSLFPINVLFENRNTTLFSNVEISKVLSSVQEGQELPFDVTSSLKSDEYIIL